MHSSISFLPPPYSAKTKMAFFCRFDPTLLSYAAAAFFTHIGLYWPFWFFLHNKIPEAGGYLARLMEIFLEFSHFFAGLSVFYDCSVLWKGRSLADELDIVDLKAPKG